jgi:hypothetical protein
MGDWVEVIPSASGSNMKLYKIEVKEDEKKLTLEETSKVKCDKTILLLF